jgi:hypothetical protein
LLIKSAFKIRVALNTIIFPENVKLSLLLNDNYLFFVSRKIDGPVTIFQFFNFINKFYQEPLTEDVNKAFQENEVWLQEILSEKHNGIQDLINFDVFSLNVDPDFCGLEYDEKTNEWIVHIGPE